MGHLFYVIKIGIATFLIVVLMQIEVSHSTIESHAENFIRKSNVFEPARQIAEGGFIALKIAYHKSLNIVDSFVTKQFRAENSPGQRKLLEIKRSLAHQRAEEKRVETKNE
jgi:hypothetical protein